ncbi:MAG TPA: response regulator [Stellaceae bacterium]|nr:response regulator [Stellaceae bacterium]
MTATIESLADAACGKVVLGVDDDADTLAMLAAVISAAGYTFMGAASGADCVRLAARCVPHLVLLDIQMPEMDGFATCRELRKRPELSAVPIAFLTPRKTAEDVRAGLAAGGNDFILKPFDIEHLRRRVRHWTAQRLKAPAMTGVPILAG